MMQRLRPAIRFFRRADQMSPASARWPNLFVVGVQKAGTTSLWHRLGEHPEIYMSPLKEPSYFSDSTFHFFPRAKDEQSYLALRRRDRRAMARRGDRRLFLGRSERGEDRAEMLGSPDRHLASRPDRASVLGLLGRRAVRVGAADVRGSGRRGTGERLAGLGPARRD
jgi:hypothetical protein